MAKFRLNKWTKIILNKYLLVGLFFVIWMLFFDQNSYLLHKNLDNEVNELNHDKAYFQNQIKVESLRLYQLQHNPEEIRRLAREKYLMKKDSEDIYIIVEQKDSLP